MFGRRRRPRADRLGGGELARRVRRAWPSTADTWWSTVLTETNRRPAISSFVSPSQTQLEDLLLTAGQPGRMGLRRTLVRRPGRTSRPPSQDLAGQPGGRRRAEGLHARSVPSRSSASSAEPSRASAASYGIAPGRPTGATARPASPVDLARVRLDEVRPGGRGAPIRMPPGGDRAAAGARCRRRRRSATAASSSRASSARPSSQHASALAVPTRTVHSGSRRPSARADASARQSQSAVLAATGPHPAEADERVEPVDR